MTRTGLQTRWVATFACALGLMPIATLEAAGLRVHADAAPSPVAAAPDGFLIRIDNDGLVPLVDLRVHAPADVQISCGNVTRTGRSFALGGSLAAGDSASCLGRLGSGQVRRSTGLMVSAREAGGAVQARHASVSNLGAPLTPAQGALVLMAGVIHADADIDGQLDAGETLSYDYTLLNLGSVALSAIAASDLSGSVSCPQSTLAVAATMTCSRTYTVTSTDATNGFVINDVRAVAVDTLGRPVSGGDVMATLNLAGSAGIRVFKSPLLLDDADASGFASVGDLLRYTFVVKNGNAQTLTAVNLVEPDPTRIDTPIVCQANTLGGAPYSGNGSGTLVANDVVLCSADYTVRVADANLGQALNLVEARANAAVAGAIVATGASAVVVPGGFLISVAKSVNMTSAFPGEVVIYTITVSNPGTLPVANVTISDPLPVGVVAYDWVCAGASCPNPTGTGAILETIPSFPAGAQVVYTVRATISNDPPDPVINIVSVTPTTLTQCAPSNLPPPCVSEVPVNIIPYAKQIPSTSTWALLLLALMLCGAAVVNLRRH